MATVSKRNFTRGIFSPEVQVRNDVEAWNAGARQLKNVFMLRQGGVRKRMGTSFVYRFPEDNSARMFPFTYSTDQSYALLFGQGTMRPMALGGAVLASGFGITAISKANPGVVTAPYHALSTGDEVYLSGIEGMTELNGRLFTIIKLTDDTFSIGVDTTGYGSFTADDGTVRSAPTPTPTPVPTPSPTPTPTPPPVYGGGGTTCVYWETPELMANEARDGPGEERPARSVKAGDYVWTRHSATGIEGAHKVLMSRFVLEECFEVDGIPFVATRRHRCDLGNGMESPFLKGRSVGMRMVHHVSIEDAQTVITAGILSHNLKPIT